MPKTIDASVNSYWKQTRFGDLFVLLLLIFALKFKNVPANTNQLLILYVIGVKILLSPKKLVFIYSRDTFRSLIPFFLFSVYIGLTTLLAGTLNLGNLSNIILIIYEYTLGAYLVVVFIFPEDFSLDRLLFTLLILFGIQGFFVLMNFLIVPYREFLLKILPLTGNIQAGSKVSMFRVRGLYHEGSALFSAFISIGLLISAYFLSTKKLNSTDKMVILVAALFIIIGILFTGRTGLVMIPIAVVLYYFLRIIHHRFRWYHLLYLIIIPAVGVGLYFLLKNLYLWTAGSHSILVERQFLFDAWERWAFGQFDRYFTGKSEGLHTVNILQTMFFIPKSDRVLLFGDPSTWAVVRTDIGYIRILFAAGVVGGLLLYSGFISVYTNMIKKVRNVDQRIFLFFLLGWQLLLEYKEPMFSNPTFVSLLMLILFVIMRQSKGKTPDDRNPQWSIT